jgi:sigma-E factor negative regulatory protein RseA
MTEIADLQISAFVDDELSRDECEFLVRRLSRDDDARRQLLRYSMIGVAMRGELLGPDPDVLRRRISAALEGVHLPTRAEPAPRSPLRRLARPALGAAIAASAAIAALLVVSAGSDRSVGNDPPVAAASAIPEAAFFEGELLPSFVVPTEADTQSSIRLTDYIVQHNQFTPAIRRASINSSVAGEQHYWRPVPPTPPAE